MQVRSENVSSNSQRASLRASFYINWRWAELMELDEHWQTIGLSLLKAEKYYDNVTDNAEDARTGDH